MYGIDICICLVVIMIVCMCKINTYVYWWGPEVQNTRLLVSILLHKCAYCCVSSYYVLQSIIIIVVVVVCVYAHLCVYVFVHV